MNMQIFISEASQKPSIHRSNTIPSCITNLLYSQFDSLCLLNANESTSINENDEANTLRNFISRNGFDYNVLNRNLKMDYLWHTKALY